MGGKEVKRMNPENEKAPRPDGENQTEGKAERLQWHFDDPKSTSRERYNPEPDFLLWFLPDFVRHVGEVLVGLSIYNFIGILTHSDKISSALEILMQSIAQLVQLFIPK